MHVDGLQETFRGHLKGKRKQDNSVLPAQVESWRILLEKEDQSVWSTDEYICTEMGGVTS